MVSDGYRYIGYVFTIKKLSFLHGSVFILKENDSFCIKIIICILSVFYQVRRYPRFCPKFNFKFAVDQFSL